MKDCILFAWRRLPPPLYWGGAEISQAILAESLVQRGFEVYYLGSLEHPRRHGTMAVQDAKADLDRLGIETTSFNNRVEWTWAGIRCIGVPQDEIEGTMTELLGILEVHRTFTSQEGSCVLALKARQSCLVVGWLHSISKVGFEVLGAEPQIALATSRFVADRAMAQVSDSTAVHVFYPPFRRPSSRSGSPVANDALLMVNPVLAKGRQLFLALARRLPHRRFYVVQGWYEEGPPINLPNVYQYSRQWDMSDVYAGSRLIIVPSVVEEGFGRVIVEAALHGVPAVASDIGGIPEAVGSGGLILTGHSEAEWAAAIEQLDDDRVYSELSLRARLGATHFLRDFISELQAQSVL